MSSTIANLAALGSILSAISAVAEAAREADKNHSSRLAPALLLEQFLDMPEEDVRKLSRNMSIRSQLLRLPLGTEVLDSTEIDVAEEFLVNLRSRCQKASILYGITGVIDTLSDSGIDFKLDVREGTEADKAYYIHTKSAWNWSVLNKHLFKSLATVTVVFLGIKITQVIREQSKSVDSLQEKVNELQAENLYLSNFVPDDIEDLTVVTF